MMRRTIALGVLAVAAASPAAGQGDPTAADDRGMATHENVPDGWMMRFDRPGATADMVDFRTMEPGWHVTTGRAGSGIYWQESMEATGNYRAATTIHLMKPAAHPEAFGLFVGGTNLNAADQSYLYFLVRQNGQYLITRRRGAGTETVVDWTASDAVPTASSEESTRYDLAIEVGDDSVDFVVNGRTVHSLPAAEVHTDGTVGVRINHMLDVHVQELEVTAGDGG